MSADDLTRSPWVPGSLRRLRPDLDPVVASGELSYVVVDDLDGDIAALVVSAWPRTDGSGRLRFHQEADVHLPVDAVALRELLDERVVVEEGMADAAEDELRRRPLQVGDVFAAALLERPDDEVGTPGDPRRWIGGPIVDLSAEAREAAKVQYYAAVADVLSEDELDEIVREFRGEGEGPSDTSPEGGPSDQGGGDEGGPTQPPLRPQGSSGEYSVASAGERPLDAGA